jgi:DNA-binding GntR family transcriptional regulator
VGLVMKRANRAGQASLRSQAVAFLRNAILSGKFKPGDVLNEKELADQFGVSKTPIREGLSLLEQQGLVQTIARRGYIVTQITVQDIHELFDLRIILESAAAERAALQMTDAQLQALSRLVPDLMPEGDIAKWLDRNVEFHNAVALISGNQRLARLIKQLLEEMQRMIAAGYVPGEHEKVLQAFRERDPRRAAEAMREHIQEVRHKTLRVAGQP